MTNTNEPRALSAALSQPAFLTKGMGLAQHVADRHVDRWAPEGSAANRIRPLRNLGFVDRLVSPWIESAQRSASLRMFSQYISTGTPERSAPSSASWVFPRPWYQDELDWMAAARHVNTQVAVEPAAAPTMLTTRGTYVAPTYQQIPSRLALPTTLHEYVAPSLSVARPQVAATANAYSPLVPAQAAYAAQMMTSAMAPLARATQQPALSPGLRAVLATMMQRSAQAQAEPIATRSSAYAPEMVTPPAPRPDMPTTRASEASLEVAERTAEQRVRIAELQRVAEREYQARVAAATRTDAPTAARIAEIQQRASEQQARREEARQADVRRDQAASTERAAAVQAERARLEERIAQRLAERTRQQEGQRLHETAREAAARDARIAAAQTDAPVATTAPAAEAAPRVSAALAAAVASLPPELASMVASTISGRPERAAQAIAELGEALRTVELMARNTAAGGTIAPSHGPRVVMPAGLGGLVATVERTTQPVGEQRAPRMFAQAAPAPIGQTFAAPAQTQSRMPAMTWLTPSAARATTTAGAPTSALGAAMQATPAALQHVAWSDRWLARFAGAQTQSLDVFTAGSTASPELRALMLANAAPETVFVAPVAEQAPRATATIATTAAPESRADQVVRYADDAETPDDVFAAIAAAATSGRAAQARPAAAPSAAQTAAIAAARSTAAVAAATQAYDPAVASARETMADLVAHAAPSAPGAGLSAQLASSPFAPALRHILPLGVAPTFDVRALFGSSLGATYLSGLIAASTNEISIARSLPTWATIGESPLTSITGEPVTREVAEWQPTYVAPEAPSAQAERGEAAEPFAAAAAPLTTLRSALLSYDVETLATPAAASSTTTSTPSVARTAAMQPTIAQALISALSTPWLADTAAAREPGAVDLAGTVAHAPSYGSPGQLADRAQAWSIAQERSTADLSFDFVSPELLLAARVYGLGPAEAAQAARLAVAGPGQLTAMAGAVDRTFVQAMAIESERRGARGRAITTAYPVAMPDGVAPSAMTATTALGDVATSASAVTPTAAPASTSAFGVERRTPRGAFLWPAATTAALGLNALAPDSEQSMSVVALELLAAQAVAELGTYAALGGVTETERAALASVASRAPDGATYTAPAAGSSTTEPSDEEVLSSAAAFVPASRRDKFQALYIALSQSPSGRVASPAARAARALALAGRGEETITARERASVAWDVLPVVYGDRAHQEETLSTGDAAARLVRRREELRAMDMLQVDSRPGLSNLASRAGEALSSYAAPAAARGATSSASGRRGEEGAVLRAPTAAQELVQTGRPAGRHGGGELEIPAWFEQAARKMLSERTSVSGDISLAELTLVSAAPPQQIAASSRSGGPSHAAAPSAAAAAPREAKQQIDVDKLAQDIYREVLAMMDVARARNGEPYL